MLSEGVVKDLKILIAASNHAAAVELKKLLSDSLQKSFLQIDFSFTYMEAIYNVVNNHYDLCLVDYALGDKQGLELLESIRGRGITMPVFFLCEDNNSEAVNEIEGAGADFIFERRNLDLQELNHAFVQSLKGSRDYLNKKHIKFVYENTNISSIIAELNPQGKVLFINQGSSKITGYNPSELIGKKWQEIFRTTNNSELLEFLKPSEKLIRTKKGQIKALEIKTRKIYSESGKVARIIINAIDVTHKISLRKKNFKFGYSILP